MNLEFGVVLILLIPLAFAGLVLMNAGFCRSRNAAHSLIAALSVAAVGSLVFIICGFAWQGTAESPGYAVVISGTQWNWIGAERFFLRGIDFSTSPRGVAACFGMFSAVMAGLIPLGSGAERWRLAPALVSSAILAGWIYPLFAHWVWGGGWLAQLGVNYGLGTGFLDAGGAAAIQVVGGLTALSIAWILGPRRGKYSHDGTPMAIPGHNVPFVLLGCAVALPGWIGLNSAAAFLFYGAMPGRTMLVAVNTILSAGSALLASAAISRVRFGKPDASLSANGWTGGLAASSACAAFEAPAEAIMLGLIAGVLVTLAVEWLEVRLGIDDPGGAISVHAVAGLWGALSVGFFGRFPPGQLLAQLVGIATLLGFILPLTYGVNRALNRLMPYRVSMDGERTGMDLHELGANAYPELASHLEDFGPR